MKSPMIITVAESTSECPRKSEGDVIELKDGRLLLAYMEFSGDGSDEAQTRIVVQESADTGRSWGRHHVITETMPGDANVYSPNLIRSRDDGILLLFMRQHSVQPTTSTFCVWKSINEGKTFSPYVEFASRQNFGLCNAVVKRLASGRLLLPCSTPIIPGKKPYCGAVFYSDDDAQTWREANNRIFLPMRGAMEMHVEETRDGRVLIVMRNQLGSLFLSESADDGLTWSKPQTTGLKSPESCPELTRIPDTGDLLMIWNNSPYDPAFGSHYGKRSPLTAAVSRDEGRTWQGFHDIEDDPGRVFSNPGCRFTRDGRAIVNYWTCEYSPNWIFSHVIDLRVAVIDTAWFYERLI